MPGTLVKSVVIDLGIKGDAAAKARLDDITRKADELKKNFPEFTAKINTAAAAERLKVFRAQLADATKDRTANVKVKVDDSALQKFADKMKAGGGPAWLGPALALTPAAGTILGVTAGAGIGLAGAFTAGAGALAAFGAVAKPVLAAALTAEQAVNAAQNAYQATIAAGVPTAQAQLALQTANTQAQLTYKAALAGGAKPAAALAAYHLALAHNQVTYNAAVNTGVFGAKAYAAEQLAIGKAYADLSPQQIALSKQIGTMAQGWQDLKAAQTPVVAGALVPWLKSVTDLTGNLGPVIAKVSPVIAGLGTQFDSLINDWSFQQFKDFIGSTGTATVSAAGSTLIDWLKSFMILLPQFDPLIREAVGWIARLGPAVLTWASSKKTADDIQAFLRWFSANGPVVGGLLRNIGGALKALTPGLTSGGVTELKILSDFFGFVAKLPKGIAGPLAETAGALLLLNKLGVFSVGVKFVGLAAGWVKRLLGGAEVDLGAAAMQRAGDTMLAAAAAMQRAADTIAGGSVKSTAGAAAGTAGKAAGGAGLAGLGAAAGLAFAGLFIGAAIRAIGDALSPAGTFAGKLNGMFQRLQIGALHSFTFGGLEGWLTAHLGMPVGKVENQILGNTRNWGADTVRAVTGAWDTTWRNTITRAAKGFHDLAGYFDRGRHDTAAATDRTRQDIANWWNISWNNTITRTARGFHDLAGWFNTGRHDTAAALDLVRHDTAAVWDLIWTSTVSRAARGVTDLGRAFGKIGGVVRAPVAAVVGSVLDPLFGFIDTVTSFVGLGRPLPQLHLAGGGRIPGFGGGDVIPALLERGETVVDKQRSRRLAGVFKAAGVPGYAAGGFVNPIGVTLRPERIDMGVDYGGSGGLFALGSGVITSLFNTGWPGGGFVGLHLDQTPPGGVPWWYYAENVAPYRIGVGSRVAAGQYIAQATGGPSGIEVGYAAPPGTGNTMASATGESRLGASHGDPGAYPTGWGVAASNLIGSLGGPRGIMAGQLIQGGTPGIAGGFAGIARTLADIFGGLGSLAKVAIDLAHGDTGAAGRALLGMVKPSAGGAGGALGRTLLGLPGVLTGDVVKFLVSGVTNFAAANAGGPAGSAGGGVQQWRGLVLQALGMEHLSLGLVGDVLYQMQTESGGNQFAQNNTDINAQLGDPSRGLMQVIGATFRAWHWPGTSWNIFDPLANIAAALNYGAHGKGFGSGTGQIGSGHGYALGTPSAAPGWAWVGEHGVPELVRFRGGEQVAPLARGSRGGGTTVIVLKIEIDPAVAASTPDRTLGRHIAEHVTSYIKSGGRLYPAGTTPR